MIATNTESDSDTSLNEIALVSYWDVGSCGAYGDDHSWGVCRYSKFNCPEMIDLDSCPTGRALKLNEYGTGEKGSYTDGTGCSYFYYTEYVCEESSSKDSDIVTDAPTSTDTSLNEIALVSYWDVGSCGAYGDDHNWGVCLYSKFNCPEMIDLQSCPTGRALKWNEYGTGEKESY